MHCALETGASIAWLLTGNGSQFEAKGADDRQRIETFTLSEESLVSTDTITISGHFFSKPFTRPIAVQAEGKLHFIEQDASLSDGVWLVDIEGAISIRELTKLPGKKLHVAGGKVVFECGIDDIKPLGRVTGVYSEPG